MRRRTDPEYCCCAGMSDAGDMAPRLWDCNVHGKTGFAGFAIMFERQRLFTYSCEVGKRRAQDEFWDFCHGVHALTKTEFRLAGKFYDDCDDMWPAVRKELDRLARKYKIITLEMPPTPPGKLSPRAFGVDDRPQVVKLKPFEAEEVVVSAKQAKALKEPFFKRLFG